MGVFDELLEQQNTDAGQIPGIVTGLVKDNWDKEHPGMVKVEYFFGEKGRNLTGWVPVAAPYAGKEYGAYTLPEVGDEVVLAFQMGDRNCPIVLGSIWSRKNALPKKTALEKNLVKRLRSKGGCEIVFSGEPGKEQILVETPKNLKILLEDEKETIRVTDKNGKNGILIDTKQGTVTLLAEKSVELKAGGKVMASFNGKSKAVTVSGGKISCKADQSLEAKGQTARLEGASVQVKGSGALKLEAGGTAQLKGAMVQIN